MHEELKEYIKKNLVVEKKRNNFFPKFKLSKSEEVSEEACFGAAQAAPLYEEEKCYQEDINLKDWIKENNKYNDFQTTLFKYIDDRNLVDADVYNKVHIDRRLFSKIRNDKNYHPSKETIILLGLSLELSEEEIEKLLDSASYSLPRNNHYDLIIRFCFMKGIYKIKEVNDLLDEYNCKLFNY